MSPIVLAVAGLMLSSSSQSQEKSPQPAPTAQGGSAGSASSPTAAKAPAPEAKPSAADKAPAAPSATAPNPGATTPEMKFSVTGHLAAAEVKKVLAEKRAEISACYKASLAEHPGLTGAVRLQWTIDATGAVSALSVLEGTLKEPALEKCLSEAVRKWVFTAPASGEAVVVYPFSFAARKEVVDLTKKQ